MGSSMPRTLSKGSEVLPAKRRALVLEKVRKDGVVSILELAAAIEASASTIRRDLEHLTAEGVLVRTHGGAVALSEPSSTFELEVNINAHLRSAQKTAIGAEAALRIRSGDSVIFDSSSTVHAAVQAATLLDLKVTAVTNSLDIAQLCANTPLWRVYVLGGQVKAGSHMLLGDAAEGLLTTMHADLCLIGTFAIADGILTDPLPEVASLKRRMIRAARKVIVLADATKFRAPAFAEFCRVEQVNEVITDASAPPDAVSELRARGITVTVVPDADD